MQYDMSEPVLFTSLSLFLLAYRLQFCLPPPIIPNAEILMASKEFKIGEFELILHHLQSDLYVCVRVGGLGLAQYKWNILSRDAGCQFIFRLERLSLIMFPE